MTDRYKENDDGTFTFKPGRLSLQELSTLEHKINRHLDSLCGQKAAALVELVGKSFGKSDIYREAFYQMFYKQLEGEISVEDVTL